MSFDVFLQHFERHLPAEADREAVAVVFRALGAKGPDDFGRHELPIGDLWEISRVAAGEAVTEVTVTGGVGAGIGPDREPYWVAVDASGLAGQEEFHGCAFFLRAFSPGIAQAIFRIAEAGALTIIAVSEAGPFLPPSVDPADLPADDYFARPRRVASGEEPGGAGFVPEHPGAQGGFGAGPPGRAGDRQQAAHLHVAGARPVRTDGGAADPIRAFGLAGAIQSAGRR